MKDGCLDSVWDNVEYTALCIRGDKLQFLQGGRYYHCRIPKLSGIQRGPETLRERKTPHLDRKIARCFPRGKAYQRLLNVAYKQMGGGRFQVTGKDKENAINASKVKHFIGVMVKDLEDKSGWTKTVADNAVPRLHVFNFKTELFEPVTSSGSANTPAMVEEEQSLTTPEIVKGDLWIADGKGIVVKTTPEQSDEIIAGFISALRCEPLVKLRETNIVEDK